MSISIIIPCYDEADGIEKLREEFVPVVRDLARTQPVEVIFVDDGSRDDTWALLNRVFGAITDLPNVAFRFERHDVNRGLGAAVRTGFAAASGDIIVTTDSDGTYKFSSIPKLLDYLTPGVDIVTASPYHPDGRVEGVPAYRLVLSQGSSFIYRILLRGSGVHCYTALYRAYRRAVIENVTFKANGFLAGTELMVKAMLMGYTVAEYPAVLYSRVHGVSKAKLARTIRAHLGFQWKVLMHRLHIKALVDRELPPPSSTHRAPSAGVSPS